MQENLFQRRLFRNSFGLGTTDSTEYGRSPEENQGQAGEIRNIQTGVNYTQDVSVKSALSRLARQPVFHSLRSGTITLTVGQWFKGEG